MVAQPAQALAQADREPREALLGFAAHAAQGFQQASERLAESLRQDSWSIYRRPSLSRSSLEQRGKNKNASALARSALGEKLHEESVVASKPRFALVLLLGQPEHEAAARLQHIVAEVVEKEIPLIEIPQALLDRIVVELAAIGGDDIEAAEIGRHLLVGLYRVFHHAPDAEPVLDAMPQGEETRTIEPHAPMSKLLTSIDKIAWSQTDIENVERGRAVELQVSRLLPGARDPPIEIGMLELVIALERLVALLLRRAAERIEGGEIETAHQVPRECCRHVEPPGSTCYRPSKCNRPFACQTA